ncbi:polyunsaturated fatty acid 5-lipoxygenase-like isoform X2 [Porites lutea]|uniref:polyunsaturated fatty acid 5-lipoxygenase-like isoform X1 n=1 Tax=Porites lutea TaxID=51062 RepID=UPI003CC6106A
MKYSLFALLVLTISLTHAKLTEYDVKTGTTDNAFAGTNANVWIKIKGEKGVTRKLLLDNPWKDDFQQGAVDDFKVYAEDVGKPMGFEVMRDDTVSNGVSAVWGIDSIGVKPYGAPKYLTFYYNFFLPAYTWIEFPRFTCLGTNEACYKEAAACPAGTKENSGKECFLKTLKCCTTETAASETKETE